jgi:hypothetical protein
MTAIQQWMFAWLPGDLTPVSVLSVSSPSAEESDPLVFTVLLSRAPRASEDVRFGLVVTDDTAQDGLDYTFDAYSDGVTLDSGDLVIPEGVSSFTITYDALARYAPQGSRTFDVSVGGVQGTGTITDDASNNPTNVGDPNKILLLLDAAGTVTHDSSVYNRTLTLNGTVTINTNKTLNGLPTYFKTKNGTANRIETAATFFSAVGAGEWCYEVYLNPTTAGTGEDRVFEVNPLSLTWASNGTVGATVGINGSSYSVSSSAGAAPVDTWSHIAVIRDNTTDASFSFLRLFINGVLVASSVSFSKVQTLNASTTSWLLGWTGISPGFSSGGVRLTGNHRRYMTNAQGAGISSFTPDLNPLLPA